MPNSTRPKRLPVNTGDRYRTHGEVLPPPGLTGPKRPSFGAAPTGPGVIECPRRQRHKVPAPPARPTPPTPALARSSSWAGQRCSRFGPSEEQHGANGSTDPQQLRDSCLQQFKQRDFAGIHACLAALRQNQANLQRALGPLLKDLSSWLARDVTENKRLGLIIPKDEALARAELWGLLLQAHATT